MSRNRRQFMRPNAPQVKWGREHMLRTMGEQIENNASAINLAGLAITPKTSIRAAINSLGDTGGRILLSEGVWVFNDLLEIDKPVELVALSPGTARFKRPATNAAGMIKVTSSGREFTSGTEKRGVVFDGIKFDDRNDSDTTNTVLIENHRTMVRDCLIVSGCKQRTATFYVSGKSYCSFIQNTFDESSASGNHILFDGSSLYNRVIGNLFLDSSAADPTVYFGNSAGNSVIVGNVAATNGEYSVKGSANNVVTGNFGTVTTR